MMSPNGARSRSDRGQAAIVLLAVVAVLVVTMSVAVAAMGRTAIDRTRAQTAADAAALAALDGGPAAATALATRHGAVVVALAVTGDVVTVTVRLGEVTATARATDAR
jgi:hypothetical protein